MTPINDPSAPAALQGEQAAEDEQSVFERWLAKECPSGDVEDVQRQWLASSDYADWFDSTQPAAPLQADTAMPQAQASMGVAKLSEVEAYSSWARTEGCSTEENMQYVWAQSEARAEWLASTTQAPQAQASDEASGRGFSPLDQLP